MANFSVHGVDALIEDMLALEEIPDEVVDKMLKASADIALRAMQDSLKKLGLIDTQQLFDSLTAVQKRNKQGKIYYLIYPRGTRHDYLTVGKIRRVGIKGHRKSGQAIKMTNNDVGFVLEFGAPRRNKKAYQWMRTALEGCADEILAVQTRIYDEWLKSKNL
nr:MAG TPA: hypothetical protein [Caudoviricetes sp.]